MSFSNKKVIFHIDFFRTAIHFEFGIRDYYLDKVPQCLLCFRVSRIYSGTSYGGQVYDRNKVRSLTVVIKTKVHPNNTVISFH